MNSHAKFALHHKKEAVKDMLRGKLKSKTQEDLSKRKAPRDGKK